MPGIENLNFEVILNYKEFEKNVKAVKDLANGLNKDVSTALDLKKKIEGASTKIVQLEEKVKQANEKTAQEAAKTATAKAKQEIAEKKLADYSKKTSDNTEKTRVAAEKTIKPLSATQNLMSSISRLTGVAFGVVGLRRFLSTLIDITGQFEVQQMALRTMLKDVDKADKIFEDLRQFAVESPYTFQELSSYTKQLAAFNIPARDLLSTNKMLADVAAGLGVSMDRLILAYGHVKSSGFLRGMQLRQFTQNGVPILEELAKQFSEMEGRAVSLGDVFDKMERRQIPFKMIEEAFKRMTSEGGTFYKMQEVLVQTLQGKIGKLRDVWQQSLYDIGQSQDGILKGSVEKLTKLVANWEETGKAIAEVAVAFGTYRLAVILAEGALYGFTKTSSSAVNSLAVLVNYIGKNPWILLAAAITGAAYAIYKWKTALTDVERIQKSVTDSIAKMERAQANEVAVLDELYAKLRLAKEGTEEYASAKEAIASKYSAYIDQLQKEGVAVSDLANLYQNLRDKIEASVADKNRASAFRELEATYDAQQENLFKRLQDSKFFGRISGYGLVERYQDNKPLNAIQKEALRQYMTGNKSVEDIESKVGEYEELAVVVRAIREDIERVNANEGKFASETNGIEELRIAYKANLDAYLSGIDQLNRAMKALTPDPNGPMTPDKPQDWYGGFGRAIRRFGSMNHGMYAGIVDEIRDQFIYKDSEHETWEKYYERLGKDYNELNNRLLHAFNDSDREFYEARVAFLKVLDEEYGGALLAGNKTVRKEDSSAVKKIMTDVNSLEAMRKVYNSLIKMGNSQPQAYVELTKRFSHVDDSLRQHFGFWDALFKKADELEKYDENAADRLRNKIVLEMTTEELKEYTASLKDSERRARASQKTTNALIDAWRRQANTLEKYKNTYLEMLGAPYNMSEGEAQRNMRKLFPGIDFGDFDFDKKIDEYIDNIRSLGARGNEFADALVASFGRDAWSRMKRERTEAEKATAALNKYLEALQKWANATQELSGTGAEYGISNAIAKYKKAIGGNDMKFWEMAVLGTNAYKNDPTKQAGEVGGLMNLWAQNRANALATLRQDILKYTDDIFKEQMHKGGFDLTNLNDKTLPQLLAIKKAIESIEVPQAVRDMLNASGDEGKDLLKKLEEAIEEYKKNYQANTLDPTLFSKAAKMAKYAAKEILSMADSIGKLNEEAGEAVGKLGDFASTVAQGFAQGNVYGAAISAVGWMAKQVIEGIAETDKFATEIEQKRLDAAFAYKNALNDIAANSKNTIFGENSIGKLREYIRIAKAYKDELEPFLNEFGFLGYSSDDVEKILADIEGGLLSGDGVERLKSVITKYKDALGQLDSIAEGVFGDVAQSAADKIVEGWIEAGDAALDYADILDDVAKAYSKMLIQSMISETFLDPITEDVKKAFRENRYEDAMAMIAGAMDGIAESAPMFEDILRAFDPYFSSSDSDTNSLGSGIKSITEETASLLASYINAMRADLSYMRGLQERGWANIEQLAGIVTPSLAEYIQQIAANTYNTAADTNRILAELQSVIGAEGSSGSIVRVQLA